MQLALREKYLLAILLSLSTSLCCTHKVAVNAFDRASRPPAGLNAVIALTSHGSLGMGIPVSTNHVLTVLHLLETNLDAVGEDRTFRVIWRDPKRDLAMLEIVEGKPFVSWAVVASGEPSPAEALYSLCYLDTIGNRVVVVSRYMGLDHDHDIILDGFSTNGMSGGALLNADGQLVGVVRATWKVNEFSRLLGVAAPVWGERF